MVIEARSFLSLEQGIHVASSAQKYPLGYKVEPDLLRAFRYGYVHASAGGHRGRPMIATSQGAERGAFLGAQVADALTVTWTCVGVVNADDFKDGWLLCQGGFVHRIKSNTAGTAGTVITLTLYDAFTAIEALAAGRYGLLLENPYSNVREHGTCNAGASGPGRCMGVTTFDGGVGVYVWLQTKGPCGVIAQPATLGDGEGEIALTVGQDVGDVVMITTGQGKQIIGHSMLCSAINWENENFMLLDLCID